MNYIELKLKFVVRLKKFFHLQHYIFENFGHRCNFLNFSGVSEAKTGNTNADEIPSNDCKSNRVLFLKV